MQYLKIRNGTLFTTLSQLGRVLYGNICCNLRIAGTAYSISPNNHPQ
jgi:hypothetical protein